MSYYYRGSSSYEVAVNNQLTNLERTGKSLQYAIYDMEYGIRNDIRESTYAIVASQEMLAQNFKHGFNSVNNTLEIGFATLLQGTKNIQASIENMSNEICSRLDAIHDIVNNPLLTQSRELFKRALKSFEKGYFEEARDDLLQAVEKNRTDYISWNLLGQIYLYGASKYSNVINLDKAEESFFNAAKYIDADIGDSDDATELAIEIYFNLGFARLAKSNDLLVGNKINESNLKLSEAENASGKSYSLSQHNNLLAGYEQAKELHFLGRDRDALSVLKELIESDESFALKASCDKNFESIWSKIDELIVQMKNELSDKLIKQCDEICAKAEEKVQTLNNEIEGFMLPTRDEFAAVVPTIKQNIRDELEHLHPIDYSTSEELLESINSLIATEEENIRLVEESAEFEEEDGMDSTDLRQAITDLQKNLAREKARKKEVELEILDYKKRNSETEARKELLKEEVTFPDSISFLKSCDDALISLKSTISEFKSAANKDFLSVCHSSEKVFERSCDEWINSFFEPLNEPLYRLKVYGELGKKKVLKIREKQKAKAERAVQKEERAVQHEKYVQESEALAQELKNDPEKLKAYNMGCLLSLLFGVIAFLGIKMFFNKELLLSIIGGIVCCCIVHAIVLGKNNKNIDDSKE